MGFGFVFLGLGFRAFGKGDFCFNTGFFLKIL